MTDARTDIPSFEPELEGLRVRCAEVAVGLFSNARAADREVEALFADIPPALKRPGNRAILEAWLLAELVFRARRHARAVATGELQRRERMAPARDRLWWRPLERGELLPLVKQLPAVYAEAFTLQYIDKVPLREMTRRTGASVGVLTHRIKEAANRLDALVASQMSGPRLHVDPAEPQSHSIPRHQEPALSPQRGAPRSGTGGSAA
jgi:DNA-directed RNA polymerase specialized sigma24 family protein